MPASSGAYDYVAPTTVEEAIQALQARQAQGERAQIMAGGTDLMVQMRAMDRGPRLIVDVKGIDDTNRLSITDQEIFIGAAIPSALLYENQALQAKLPGLLEGADLIGSTQIQGRATIGGNLCNASPAGDSIPAIMASQGRCVIAGPEGTREVAAEDFVVGVQRNCLADAEFLVGLKFPTPDGNTSDAYLRFIPRTEMDIAVAGCGVSLTLDANGSCSRARVAIGAVAPTAILVPAAAAALEGSKLEDEALAAAAAACSAAASPISDKRGTAEYRRKVVGVLCKRAALKAAERIKG